MDGVLTTKRRILISYRSNRRLSAALTFARSRSSHDAEPHAEGSQSQLEVNPDESRDDETCFVKGDRQHVVGHVIVDAYGAIEDSCGARPTAFQLGLVEGEVDALPTSATRRTFAVVVHECVERHNDDPEA